MKAGIQLNFYLGQRIIYDELPGKLIALSIEDDGIIGTIILDEPIVIDELRIFKQCVQIHEIKAA